MPRVRVALALVAVLSAVAVWQFAFKPGSEKAASLDEEPADAGATFARAVPPATVLAAMNAVRVSHGCVSSSG